MMVFKRTSKRKPETEDLGLRLLKLLLYRLYSMSYVMPLKWYEILIAVVLGVLMGLGIGSVVYSAIKPHIKVVK